MKIFRHFLLGDECATVEICIVTLVAAKENSVFLYRVHDDSLRKKLGYQVVKHGDELILCDFPTYPVEHFTSV